MGNCKIVVAGTGYVGLSVACLLAQNNPVSAVEINKEKVEKLNKRISPFQDNEIQEFLQRSTLQLHVTQDSSIYKSADYVIVATPTNYDESKNFFDTSAVESVINLVTEINPNAYIVIKSAQS